MERAPIAAVALLTATIVFTVLRRRWGGKAKNGAASKDGGPPDSQHWTDTSPAPPRRFTASVTRPKYDVFISHCGADCKRDFAVWLKTELENVGIKCFFDEHSLEVGDTAADAMLDAMETATYGIVILSPGFFEREWCMKELQTFVSRKKILPIFYGQFEAVQAARKAAVKGRVWTGFSKFVRTEDEYVAAANASTERTGFRLAEEGWWSSCIRRLRDEMLKLLGKEKGGVRISDDDLLVGQHEHLVKLKQLLGVTKPDEGGNRAETASQEVGIVGVKGMGGVGKSTLAKKLYDDPDVREWFTGGVCWLEVGPKPSNEKIRDLQKQMVKQLCNLDEDPGNPTRGRASLRERLGGKKVLICLDDVWESIPLAKPIVVIKDLALGSRILKTSRIKEAVGGVVHDLDVLDDQSAWELFNWHAFGGKSPPGELEPSAQMAHKKCAGLPLALSILGRQVALTDEKLQRLESFTTMPKYDDVMAGCCEVIRRSYMELPPDLADAFLLIAGLWPDSWEFRNQERMVQNLSATVYGEEPVHHRARLALSSLEKLISRSLIKLKISETNYVHVHVHDLIVETAQKFVHNDGSMTRRGFFARLEGDATTDLAMRTRGEHVRLSESQISTTSQATLNSRIFSFVGNLITPQLTISPEAQCCRFLCVHGGHFQGVEHLQNLQCLRLLQSLQEGHSFESILEAVPTFVHLQVLEILECRLKEFPESFGRLKSLAVLRLIRCKSLLALPESVGQLVDLIEVCLKEGSSLQSLPSSLGQLRKLVKLNLRGCSSLAALPDSMCELTELSQLKLGQCKSLASLPESIGRLTGLRLLDVYGCESLTTLPNTLGQLTRLTELELGPGSSIKVAALPEAFGGLAGLMVLVFYELKMLAALPESFGKLTGLEILKFKVCPSLATLPESFGRLTGLKVLEFEACSSLAALPNSFGQLVGLRFLKLLGCVLLTALPESIGQLTSLQSLIFGQCEALITIPDSVGQLTRLEVLGFEECNLLTTVPASMGKLTGLILMGFWCCKSLTALPASLGQLTGLKELCLIECTSLVALPKSLDQLTELHVSFSDEDPDSIAEIIFQKVEDDSPEEKAGGAWGSLRIDL